MWGKLLLSLGSMLFTEIMLKKVVLIVIKNILSLAEKAAESMEKKAKNTEALWDDHVFKALKQIIGISKKALGFK